MKELEGHMQREQPDGKALCGHPGAYIIDAAYGETERVSCERCIEMYSRRTAVPVGGRRDSRIRNDGETSVTPA